MSPCESCKVNKTVQHIRSVEDKKVQRLLAILAKKIAQSNQSGTPSKKTA
jgi:hypothetical protein